MTFHRFLDEIFLMRRHCILNCPIRSNHYLQSNVVRRSFVALNRKRHRKELLFIETNIAHVFPCLKNCCGQSEIVFLLYLFGLNKSRKPLIVVTPDCQCLQRKGFLRPCRRSDIRHTWSRRKGVRLPGADARPPLQKRYLPFSGSENRVCNFQCGYTRKSYFSASSSQLTSTAVMAEAALSTDVRFRPPWPYRISVVMKQLAQPANPLLSL